MASLREQILRRKPVTAMAEETGADTRGRRAQALDHPVPALAVRDRRDDRHGHLHRALRGGADRRPGGDPVVRHGRGRGRADGDLLRRAGQRRAGLRLLVLVRLRHDGRGRRGGRRGVPAARVRRRRRGGRRRLVAVPQRGARQPVRLHDPGEPVERAGAGRLLQRAGRGPAAAVHAAADPRGERVRADQRDHGDHQGLRARAVHRRSARPAGTPTTCRTSPRSAPTASRRRPASSSSPT